MNEKNQKLLFCGAIVVGLASTCGLSTVRGVAGSISARATFVSLAKTIESKKLDPECFVANPKIAEALDPVLGSENAKKVANDLAPYVSSFKQDMLNAKSDDDREDATRRLACRVFNALEDAAIRGSSPSEARDAGWTYWTIYAQGMQSTSMARDAVYGPKANECVSAILRVCSE